jgi:U2 small nuclear ribonucleoprotein B''
MLRGNTILQRNQAEDAIEKACRGGSVLCSAYFSQLTLATGKGDTAAAPTRRPAVQMPDEYLPPNKILFLQNLPDGTTHARLTELFAPHPGLHEVRMIPTKRDIAFVEFADETTSAVAKDALHNFRIDGEHKIKASVLPRRAQPELTGISRRSRLRGRRSRGIRREQA